MNSKPSLTSDKQGVGKVVKLVETIKFKWLNVKALGTFNKHLVFLYL